MHIYICIYIYIYIYIYIHKKCQFKCVRSNIHESKIHTEFIQITNIFPSFQKLCQCIIKLQTKIQITQ